MSFASRFSGSVAARLSAVCVALLVASVAFAQPQPQPQPQPRPPPGGQMRPPGQMQPGAPGQPPMRPRPQPGQMPPGHPQLPGMPPGGMPGQPGQPGMRPQMPRPGGKAPERPSAHGDDHGAAAHKPDHCPGHGPMDSPGRFNFGRGLLGIDNEKAPPALEDSHAITWAPSLWRYENKDDPCDPRNEPPPFLANLINFGVLVFLLVRFGRKPIAEALKKRKESIMKEIVTAEELLRAAKRRLKEIKQKRSALAETHAELISEYAAQAEVEKKRVLAEAEERRVRMRRDAEFRIEQELKTVRVELLNEAVIGAVAAAEELLKKRVAPPDLDRVNDDYVASIAKAMADTGVAQKAQPGGAA